MPEPRIYSEEEMALIVRRAAELQETGPGYSEQELRRIAGEAGIEPEYLNTALNELREGRTPTVRPFTLSREFERVVPFELKADEFDEILDLVKPTKTMTQVGRTLQGTINIAWDTPMLQITARSGRTRVRIRTGFESAATASVFFFIALLFVTTWAFRMAPILGILALCLQFGLTAVALVTCIQASQRRAETLVGDIADRIEDLVALRSVLSVEVASIATDAIPAENPA